MLFRSTGFGAWLGVIRAADAPSQAATAQDVAGDGPARFHDTPFRTDVVDITLQSSDKGPAVSELEYKVRMKAGDSLIYSWTVDGLDDPEEFYFDFHGETPAGPENPKPTVVEYHQSTGGQSHGTLVAPIAGVHGWYLQNQSAATVVVRLKLSGFYELVPPGQYGNLNGIVARPILP